MFKAVQMFFMMILKLKKRFIFQLMRDLTLQELLLDPKALIKKDLRKEQVAKLLLEVEVHKKKAKRLKKMIGNLFMF